MEIQWWFFKVSKYVPAISSSTDEKFYLAFNLYFQQQLWVWTSLSQFRPVQNCFRPDQAFVKFFEMLCQGRHGWQSPQGPGLSWILQNRKRQRQWQHAADVSITVAALPAENWPWRPWLLWYSTNLETYRENQIDENYNKLLFGELSSGWYYYINCVSAPGSHKLPHTGRQMGVGISGLHLNDLLTGKKKTIWLRLTSMNIHSNCHTYLLC